MASRGQHSASKEVIAYSEESQPVHLVYDTWTPRPHFIFVQRQPKSDATADELCATFELTGRFLLANPGFAEDAILSFHRGAWYQQHTGKWHVHLCVPHQAYLEKARTEITEISSNKEWAGARTVDDGMRNWYDRKVRSYRNYQNDCVQKTDPGQSRVENVALRTFDSNEFTLVRLASTPRIGIVAQTPTQSNLGSLFTFMSNVLVNAEKELGRADRSFANFGCHLCLYVRGQSGTSVTCRAGQVLTDSGLSEVPNIVGYIQMDESQYAQWMPSSLRKTWLKAFSGTNHFVRT